MLFANPCASRACIIRGKKEKRRRRNSALCFRSNPKIRPLSK